MATRDESEKETALAMAIWRLGYKEGTHLFVSAGGHRKLTAAAEEESLHKYT